MKGDEHRPRRPCRMRENVILKWNAKYNGFNKFTKETVVHVFVLKVSNGVTEC